MKGDKPPPEVTISDPNRPGVPIDLLDAGEPEPWRPSRGQWQVALSALLMLLLLSPVVLLVQHRRDEAAKDRAAIAAIDLVPAAPDNPDAYEEGRVSLGIRNDGPDVVHLLSYRVDLPGYTEHRVGQDIEPYTQLPLQVPEQGVCDSSLFDTGPVTMRLSVRTSRGDLTTRTVPARASDGGAFRAQSRGRCRLLIPQEAFGFLPEHAKRRGDGLEVTLRLFNHGRLPLTLTGLQPFAGVEITLPLRLPLALKSEPREDTARGIRTTLRIRITDCSRALESLEDNGDGEHIAHITFDLTGPSGPTESFRYLLYLQGDSLARFVIQTCGQPQ